MDSMVWAADAAGEGIYTGNMHDHSGFHNLSQQPESCPVVRVSYAGKDCVCAATPFG